jgi:hypothetical protein
MKIEGNDRKDSNDEIHSITYGFPRTGYITHSEHRCIH